MYQGNHTSVWNIERRLAHLQGTKLPFQPTLTAVGVWVAAQMVWGALWIVILGGPSLATAAYVLAPPILAAWVVERIRIDDRPIIAHLLALIRHRSQPGTLCRFEAHTAPGQHSVTGPLWTAHGGTPQ